ncbi:MAG: trigger factor [Pseudonocardiales bacterium]|nr:trigger factor [Pseudonocardiales bacterium]
MKSTVEQLSPTRVRIIVEVPFDELKPNFDRAYRKLAQQVKIPGFRPGKAPARVLENRLGRGVVLDEVVNEAIQTKYSEAVSTEEVRPLSRPDIEVTQIEDGVSLAFTAEVDVRPEFTLPDPAGIEVTVDAVEVTDDDVTEQLDGLRIRFGTLTDVDRPAANDDYVVINLSATVDSQEVPEADTTGLSYQIGSGGLLEGIDEALTGLSAGESATFTATLVAGKFVDREADVLAAVTAVKHRELPEADDEFAQLASEFDTLEELTADLRDRVGKAKRGLQATQARDKVLDELLERTEIPLPDSVLGAEVDVRQHDAIHAFDHDEERFVQWLAEQGKSRAEFDASAREEAERSVKTQLLLDAVADAEKVVVSDVELTQQIIAQAQRYELPPQEFLQQAQQSGQLGVVYADVRRGKALVTAVRLATVTDEAGNAVDLTEFLGEPDAGPGAETVEPDAEPGAETAEAGEIEAGDDTETSDEIEAGDSTAAAGQAAAPEPEPTAAVEARA